MNPLVSVVVPTYRRNETLKKALDSLFTQDYSPIEVIVIDDNADKTWNDAVKSIVEEYPSVVYICNRSNFGSAKTRNIGIKASSGEYITFLDDDDLYLPQKISHQLKPMIDNHADFSLTDLNLYNENDKLVDKRVRKYIKSYDGQSLLQYHLMYNMTGTDTIMFKKDYITKIGGFPSIDVGDEFYLMKEAISGGGKFIYIPGCFVKAYIHTDNSGLSSGKEKINGEVELYKYKKNYFSDVDRKTQRYIKMRHYAVLAYTYLRMKKYGCFLLYSAKSFIMSPLSSAKIIINR